MRSKCIEQYIGPESLVPTRVSTFGSSTLIPHAHAPYENAFSQRLSALGFNFFSIFVPDLLHEFELGVWKALFTHLLRVLYAYGGDGISELNQR